MNKRIKKKRSLLPRIEALEQENELIFNLLMQTSARLDELYRINERNAKAINKRFDDLEKTAKKVKWPFVK